MDKAKKKPRTYTEGDAEVTVSYHPHGRPVRVYGRIGYPYPYIAYFKKQGQNIFATSFRGDIRVKDIKAILHDVSKVSMPKHFAKTGDFWERYCKRGK